MFFIFYMFFMKNLEVACFYYNSLSKKNLDDSISCYSNDVVLRSPLGTVSGKVEASNSLKGFANIVKSISIKNSFVLGNKVALGLNFSCDEPFGDFFAIVIMMFDKDNKIISSELFYDDEFFRKEKFDI